MAARRPTRNPYLAAASGRRDADARPEGRAAAARGSRVERISMSGGGVKFVVYVPTANPAFDEQLDLSDWARFPSLAEPLAEALCAMISRSSTALAARAKVGGLAVFRSFLTEEVGCELLSSFGIRHLSRSLVNAYIKWLNRIDPETRGAVYKPKSRSLALSALRTLVAAFRSGRWSGELRDDLHVPLGVWSAAECSSAPVNIISRPAFEHLYRACVSDVLEAEAMFREGQRLISEARASQAPAGSILTRGDLNDLGTRLATIDAVWPGPFPRQKDVSEQERALLLAIQANGGQAMHASYFYPAPHHLTPFVLLLAILTAFNPDAILSLTHADVFTENVLGSSRTSIVRHEEDEPEGERIRIRRYKPRAHALQQRSFPVTADADNPATLLAFVTEWTGRLRSAASPLDQQRIFLFRAANGGNGSQSFGRAAAGRTVSPSTDSCWSVGLKRFQKKHGFDHFTLKQVRATVLDIVHSLSGGDLRAVMAAGGQSDPATVEAHYKSAAARAREDEALAQAVGLMWRDRVTTGRSDARGEAEAGGDATAATPGWSCLDHLASPIPGQREGRPCEAYGKCPACPLARLDL